MSTRSDRRLLAERFPKCFSPVGGKREKRPLKMGIIQDLVQRGVMDRDGWPLSPERIAAAVNSYKAGPRYLKAMAKGGVRIDIDGNPCGVVGRRHQAEAQRLVEVMDRAKKGEAA